MSNEVKDVSLAQARAALETVAPQGTDDEESLVFLLTNLLHWCEENAVDFDAALIAATELHEGEYL